MTIRLLRRHQVAIRTDRRLHLQFQPYPLTRPLLRMRLHSIMVLPLVLTPLPPLHQARILLLLASVPPHEQVASIFCRDTCSTLESSAPYDYLSAAIFVDCSIYS